MFSSAKAIAILLFGCAVCLGQSTLNPSWIYSSYFGGSQSDGITAIARDSAGNVYVTGTSQSPDFPTTAGVYEPNYPGPAGDYAIFVAKFSAEGALVWSTFLGPGTSNFVVSGGIQVDHDQNVYVAGIFPDKGYPTTPGLPRNGDVFFTKLDPSGSQLVYSGKMAINSNQSTPEIVLDSRDNAFVIGSGGAGSCCNNHTGLIGPGGGIGDFWVAEINAAGTGVPWSVAVGGSGLDNANSIAIDSNNKLYIAGYSDSTDFPTTPGALNQPGLGRTFVVKLDPTLPPSQSEVYGALIGDPGNSPNSYIEAESIAVDQAGDAFVGNWTYNIGLFTSKWAFQPKTPVGQPNAYVFELNQAGSALLNGTYLGGGGSDYVGQVSVDTEGNAYVSGFDWSWDFSTTAYGNPPIPFNVETAYYVKLNPAFAAISSVDFGGLQWTQNWSSIPDGAGGLWVSGDVGSNFPTTPNAYQPLYQGNIDGYLFHTNFEGLCAAANNSVNICTVAANGNNTERIEFAAQSGDLETAANISLNIDGMLAYSRHAAQFDTWLPVAPGNHVAKAVALNTNGTSYESQVPFNVTAASTCPLNPVVPSITLCSPLNAAAIQSPTTIVAQANDSAPPTGVRLLVDGKFQANVKGVNGTYTYSLQLSPGVHNVSVDGKDSTKDYVSAGAVFSVVQK